MPIGNPIATMADRVRTRLAILRGSIGRRDAGAFHEAVRAAYKADTPIDAPRPIGPAETAESPPSGLRPAPPIRPDVVPDHRTTIRPVEPALPAAVAEPDPERRPVVDPTAPESTLRTPISVTSVAEDFFESLIRRVEGDR
jgi:hypothetical protein